MLKVFIDLGTTNLKIETYKHKKLKDKFTISNKDIYFDKDNYFYADKLFKFLKKYFISLNDKYDENIFVIFSSAMHTLIFLDDNYNQIGKGHSLLEKIDFKLNEDKKIFYRKINKLVNSEFLPIYKINKFNKINYNSITTLKSYILYKFTCEKVIEISDAVGLGLIDSKNRVFSKEIISSINLKEELLPQLILERKIFECNLKKFLLKIDLGISDGASAAIGSTFNKNSISLSIGTTLGIRYITSKFVDTISDFDYCFPIYNDKWIYGISSSNGANNIELIISKMNLTLGDLNNINFSNAKLINKKVFFYKERFNQSILEIKNTNFNIDLLYTYIIQMINRVKKYKNIIDLNKKIESQIIATGGLFNNVHIAALFKKEFKNDIIISKDNNFSITGLKKIIQNW
ncbi:hypothetical protein [Spiroplasma endosymbiont of Cantharis rufa]|uniref:hypothetical protein n=1 Tax=Spiroplasma endosymbiont of Cantharis rufa TaxID=3066279 RepID=UPI0030D31099